MGDTDDARIAALRRMLSSLQSGNHVSNRDMRKALGDEAYADFESAWQAQQELRAQLKGKPDAVREYEALLKAAIFADNKAEGASTTGRHKAARAARHKADAAFERAYERLRELVDADPSLTAWFDRDVRWDATNAPSFCREDAPKVITSKSLDKIGGGLVAGFRNKREVKIATIEAALADLNESDESKAATQERLDRVLNRVRLGKR